MLRLLAFGDMKSVVSSEEALKEVKVNEFEAAAAAAAAAPEEDKEPTVWSETFSVLLSVLLSLSLSLSLSLASLLSRVLVLPM